MGRVLVAGPYVGEFGWECFSWQPLVRQAFLLGAYDRCLVFTGPGRTWMYRFAETRTLDGIPSHEPECLAWSNLPVYRQELDQLTARMKDAARAECPDDEHALLTYTSVPSLSDPMYGRGSPDLLYPDDGVPGNAFFRDDGRPRIVLCVRDRALADHRNWPYESWAQLAQTLSKRFDVCVVGKVAYPDRWKMPDGVNDWTGKTTVDDLIAMFSQARVVVGGSTGTIHLASRCSVDHLTWGAENSTKFPLSDRYAESNWFGARHEVMTEAAWEPKPEDIAERLEYLLGVWKEERKARVVLTFDDATEDQVAAADALTADGLRGTFGVVAFRAGTPGFATWQQLADMRRAGHCIVNHSAYHHRIAGDSSRPHLRPVGPGGVLADAFAGREMLDREGFHGDYYMAPFGTDNVGGPEGLAELRKSFPWVRLTIGAPKGDGWLPSGMHRHFPSDQRGVFGVTAAADCRWPGRIVRTIDDCIRARTTCVLLYHRVCHVVGHEQDITWQDFLADMKYLKEKVAAGLIEVVTPEVLV